MGHLVQQHEQHVADHELGELLPRPLRAAVGPRVANGFDPL
jgi:hypothetical protein